MTKTLFTEIMKDLMNCMWTNNNSCHRWIYMFHHWWPYRIWSCVFDENLNHLKGLKNSDMKLKNKLERVLTYSNQIEVVNTSTRIFKIVSQWTPPETPQYNRVFKWKNCILLDMVRSMMNCTDFPLLYRTISYKPLLTFRKDSIKIYW